MAGIVAKHRYQMKFCNSHLTLKIFNLYMRRFFFGLVYIFVDTAILTYYCTIQLVAGDVL